MSNRMFKICRQSIALFLMVGLLEACSGNSGKARCYYVSNDGDDKNSGLSADQPWKSITRVNEQEAFLPGDRILFRCGDKWCDTLALTPRGSGSLGKEIVLGRYGEGDKPIIQITAGDDDAVRLRGQSHWIIENIEVRSENGNGIAVDGGENKAVENILIRGVYAINCSYRYGQREFDHCGIRVGNHGKNTFIPEGSRFVNVKIENCVVDNCATGIMIAGRKFDATKEDIGDTVSRNNHISNCIARNLRGDGIVIFCSADVSITNSLCYNASSYNGDNKCTAGIWTWNVRNGRVSGCESYGHLEPGCDRNPFDSDYHSYNVIFEHNYGHDCYGSAILMCAPGGTNDMTVFRYNVFRNCGAGNNRQKGFIYFYDCDIPQRRYIHNNTFVGNPISAFGSTDGKKSWCYVYNNIFYHTEGMKYNGVEMGHPHDYNLWYNVAGIKDESNAVIADPLFSQVTETGVGFCDGLKILSGSPAIDAGCDLTSLSIGLTEMGTADYWGNKVPYGNYDIGAHEYVP